LTGEEVHWAAEYATWADGFGESLVAEVRAREDVLGSARGRERYDEATTDLRECASSFDDLDEPPARLAPTLAALRAMCNDVAPAVERLREASDPAARLDAFIGVEQASGRVYLELQRIDGALNELTLARGALRRRGGAESTSRVEPELTALAGRVADGRSVEVRCWSDSDWRRVLDEEGALTRGAMSVDTVGAFAQPLTGTVHLQQEQCAPLVRLLEGAHLPQGDELYDVAIAVGTLSHEIQHIVSPTASEAATECAAVQHNAEVATEAGVSPVEAREIAQYYWERVYPEEDDEYVTDDCRAGGELDLSPETDGWPTG
jgi:hypothetical protein